MRKGVRYMQFVPFFGRTLAAVLVGLAVSQMSWANEAGTAGMTKEQVAKAEADANNPLANMTAFNLHDYYIGELTGADGEGSNESANQFWARYAKPFSLGKSSWLLRASLPVNSYPVKSDGSTSTGLGDLNVFAAWLVDVGVDGLSFGVGPQVTAPTATKDGLGTEKWSAGLVNVLFDGRSARFQYGYLLSWQGSFAGSSNATDVNLGTFQYFAFYQLGKGHYLRSAPIWLYDFEKDTYSVPIGLGYGKVFKRKSTVFNAFVEPQWSAADKGAGYPEWQVFLGFNMQFIGG